MSKKALEVRRLQTGFDSIKRENEYINGESSEGAGNKDIDIGIVEGHIPSHNNCSFGEKTRYILKLRSTQVPK